MSTNLLTAIKCWHTPDTDRLEVYSEVYDDETRAVMLTNHMCDDTPRFDSKGRPLEAMVQATIILDEAKARELFNLLGVWLHGGVRS